jgi:transcriptional regulator with XRE-family HTH domain
MITSDQCRAAWVLAGLSAIELAKKAGVGMATIKRFESGLAVQADTIEAITTALTEAGIAFIAAGQLSAEGGEGVRIAPNYPG